MPWCRVWRIWKLGVPHNLSLYLEKARLTISSKKADIPIYSFEKHARLEKTNTIYSPHVLILEGIFALHDQRVLDMLDLKIFAEADPDLCLSRRRKTSRKCFYGSFCALNHWPLLISSSQRCHPSRPWHWRLHKTMVLLRQTQLSQIRRTPTKCRRSHCTSRSRE